MDQRRIRRLVDQMAAHNVDCVAVMPGANLFYLAGVSFRLSERPTLAFFSRQAAAAAVVPSFEVERFSAGSHEGEWQLFPWSDTTGAGPAFAAAARALGLAGKALAIEEGIMRVSELRLLETVAPGVRFIRAEPLLEDLRLRKDAAELASMRRAVAIVEESLAALLAKVHVGMSERMIASQLVAELTQRGAETLAFDPTVVTGPNTALPHGGPGDRPLGTGDFLLLDFGATIGGYASDITRTVAVGEIDPELERIYETVKRANAAGRAAARPGIQIQEVDRAARRVIEEAGYGQYFKHRTGHGLGLDVHEPPYVQDGNATVLEPGMTFTVEPGIYLPGRGGVRIEDDLVITPGGNESLTTFDRELRRL